MKIDESKITRVEVITPKGREFVNWNCKPKIEVQDDGQTLKIFTKKKSSIKKKGFQSKYLELKWTDFEKKDIKEALKDLERYKKNFKEALKNDTH